MEARGVKMQLQQAIEDGYTIHYVDEFVTTKSTMPTHDWTPVNAAFQIDYKQYHTRTIASIVSISKEGSVELVMNFTRSVNIPKLLSFLEQLRSLKPNEKMAVFLDQLSVHRSNDAKTLMDELGIKYIFNAAYSPNYNPIEGVISVGKGKVKKVRLRALALN